MDYKEYMRIHNGLLEGNPCKIFEYLIIEGHEVKFKEREEKLEKPSSQKLAKTKTVL